MKTFQRAVTARLRQLPTHLSVALASLAGVLSELHAEAGYSVRLAASGLNQYVRPVITGPVKAFMLGRRTGVSVGLILASPVSTIVVALWIRTTTGYLPLQSWVRETLTGTQPHAIVFLGVAALLGLGMLVSAANSGLVPTTLIVSGPVFGAAVTKYGTIYTEPHMAGQIVSLPEAVEFALAGAILVGVPIAMFGFVLGLLLRHGLRKSNALRTE